MNFYSNLRPPLPDTLIPELKIMLENVFEEKSKKRPTFSEIIEAFSTLKVIFTLTVSLYFLMSSSSV